MEAAQGEGLSAGNGNVIQRRMLQRLGILTANNLDVMWTSDASGQIFFVSDNIERVFALGSDQVYQEGKPAWLGRVHSDDLARVSEAHEALAKADKTFDLEYRFQIGGGEWTWVRDRVVRTYEADGRKYADGIWTDIGEQREEVQKQRRRADQYEAISESSCFWESWIGLDGVLGWVSNHVEGVTGYSAEECLEMGDFPLELFFEEDRNKVLAVFRHNVAKCTHGNQRAIRLRHRSGRELWADISWQPIFGPDRVCLGQCSSIYDITERKGTEDALRRKCDTLELRNKRLAAELEVAGRPLQQHRFMSERLGAIADAMTLYVESGNWREPSAVILRHAMNMTRSEIGFVSLVSEDGKVLVTASEGFEWDVDPMSDVRRVDEESSTEVGYTELVSGGSVFAQVIADRKAVVVNAAQSGHDAFVLSAGHPQIVRFLAAPVTDGHAVVALLLVANSEQPYTEEDSAQLESLGDAVSVVLGDCRRREREVELEKRLRLSERLASIGTLAAGLAHEINNPVGSILLAAQYALESNQAPGADGIAKTALADIVEDARRAGRIIKGVLQFARQEPPEKWLHAVNEVVRDAVDLVQKDVKGGNVVIMTKLAAGLPHVMLNPTEMAQVLFNIITNAHQACREGEVGGRITIETSLALGVVRTVVADDGPGMAKERLDHVFDPFFTDRRREGGTGLGLSISHGIVREHGGKIDVESKEGEGTRVIIELPVAAAE